MNLRKVTSAIAALALSCASFAGLTLTAEAADVLSATLTEVPADGANYTWGSGTTTIDSTGLKLSNGSSTGGNYTDRELVTFTTPIGGTSTSINLSYSTRAQDTSNVSKGQANTYLTVSYWDSDGNKIADVVEAVGNWANQAYIQVGSATTYLASDLAKNAFTNLASYFVFDADGGGQISVGGAVADFETSSNLKKITLSVSGGSDYNRGLYIKDLEISSAGAGTVNVNYYNVNDSNSLLTTKSYTVPEGNSFTASTSKLTVNGTDYTYDATNDNNNLNVASVTTAGATCSVYVKPLPSSTVEYFDFEENRPSWSFTGSRSQVSSSMSTYYTMNSYGAAWGKLTTTSYDDDNITISFDASVNYYNGGRNSILTFVDDTTSLTPIFNIYAATNYGLYVGAAQSTSAYTAANYSSAYSNSGGKYHNIKAVLTKNSSGTYDVSVYVDGSATAAKTGTSSATSIGGAYLYGTSSTTNVYLDNYSVYDVTNNITCSSANVDVADKAANGETVTISPDSGYDLSGAPTVVKTSDGTTTVSVVDNGNGTYSFTMPDEGVTVTAAVVANPTYTITADNENSVNGTVSADSSAHEGDIVAVSAVPTNTTWASSYDAHITVTGDTSNTVYVDYDGTSTTFEMPAENVTAVATFTAKPGYVTGITKGGASIINLTGDNVVSSPGLTIAATNINNNAAYKLTLAPVSIEGRALSFSILVSTGNSNNGNDETGSFELYNNSTQRTALTTIGFNSKDRTITINGNTIDASSAVDIVIIVPENDSSAYVFVDKKLVQTIANATEVLGYLEINRSLNKPNITVTGLQITDAPTTYTVTGGGVAGTYISGKTLTLGASTGDYWTDGTTNYSAGDEYTVTGNVTFTPVYGITCADTGVNVPAAAAENDAITISPKAGYAISGTPTVATTSGSTPVAVTDNGNGTYSFTMPAASVTVTATTALTAPEPYEPPAASTRDKKTYSTGIVSSISRTAITGNSKGEGYTYYAVFDFYLPETGKVTYQGLHSDSNSSLSTSITLGENSYYTSGTNTNISGTLENNTWYRCVISCDLGTSLSGNLSSETMTLTINDMSGTTVLTQSNIGFRNAGSGLDYLLFSSENGGSIANVITYFEADLNTITCSSANVTVPANAYCGDTITVTPAENYAVTSVTVEKSDDSYVTVTAQADGNGAYTFTMPAYAVTVTATATEIQYLESLTVNCKAGDTVLSTANLFESGQTVGYVYSYSPAAYILYNGSYYKYDGIDPVNGSVAKLTRTASQVNEELVVNYTLVPDVVAFAEVNVSNRDDTHSPFENAAANEYASAGMHGGTAYGSEESRCLQAFSVPSAGTYQITVNAVGTHSKDRACYLTVDSRDKADSLGMLSCNNGQLNKQTVTVYLTSGEHNFFYITNGGISPRLDYMVVEKVNTITSAMDSSSFTVDKIGAKAGETITISAASDYKLYGTPAVVKTSDGSSTGITPSASGDNYTFTMPAYDVTIQCLGYSTPEEIDYTSTTYTDNNPQTVGDGRYARGFTFMTYSGGLTYDSVSVGVTGANKSKYGDEDYTNSTTSTATFSTAITGDAIFGIVIWTANENKKDTIKNFDPANFTVAID